MHHQSGNAHFEKKFVYFQRFLGAFLIFPKLWTGFADKISTTFPTLLLWYLRNDLANLNTLRFHFDKKKVFTFNIFPFEICNLNSKGLNLHRSVFREGEGSFENYSMGIYLWQIWCILIATVFGVKYFKVSKCFSSFNLPLVELQSFQIFFTCGALIVLLKLQNKFFCDN